MNSSNDLELNEHDQLPDVEEYKAGIGYKTKGSPSMRKQLEPNGLDACVPDPHPQLTVGSSDPDEDLDVAILNDSLPMALEFKSHDDGKSNVMWKFCALFSFIVAIIVIIIVATSGNKDEDNWIRFTQHFENIRVYLIQNGISESHDMFNKTSPQFYAAQWLAHKDGMQMKVPDPYSSTHAGFVERYALAVMYFALGGSEWIHQVNFLSNEHVCTWYEDLESSLDGEFQTLGVHACRREENELVPHSIYLPNNNLKGTIPREIAALDRLDIIFLQFNPDITGTIPKAMSDMSQLRHVALQWCGLTGTIPTWMGTMENLKYLGLGNNQLSGSIPTEIAQLTNLELLGLDDNNLSGNIEVFHTLEKLRSLYLEDNHFTGTISDVLMQSWPDLDELDISGNKLTGSLPENMFALNLQLKVLDLHGNEFEGALPTEFADNSEMEFLALHKNKFTDKVPSGIANLKKLRHLDLNFNNFISTIPQELGQLTNLEYLFLGTNTWEKGGFPTFMIELTNLRDLSLKNARLTGKIPNYLNYLSNLQFLDLHYNELTGTIPPFIGFLTDLRHLLLKSNQLTGTIPSEMADLTNLDVLLLEHNQFTGNADAVCKSSYQSELQFFVTDCNNGIECSCCDKCCDGDESDMCNAGDWDGSLDPIWEYGYRRGRYSYDMGPSVVVVP